MAKAPSIPSPPPPSPVEQLASLGITHEVLRRIVIYGERRGRDTAVQVDPPAHAGWSAWAMRVRQMAIALAPYGWRREDVRGQSWIMSEDGRHAIWTCSGNARTGLSGRPYPKAAHSRGPVTQWSTVNNAEQLGLAFPDFEEDRPSLIESNMYVWVLLVCKIETEDDAPDVARYELSIPIGIECANFTDFNVRGWLGEVFLDHVDDDDDGGDDDLDLDIDVPVTRR